MFIKKFRLLSWNVRGAGSDEKCNVLRNVIKNSRSDVVLLQETKSNRMDCFYIMRILPNFYNYETVFNLASHSAGGIVIAWRKSFDLINSWSTAHTITAVLKHKATAKCITVTNVYGPTQDILKPLFIDELRYVAGVINGPWILAGDFNQVRWLIDRSASNRSFNLMDLYNGFIQDSELIDIPLRNRNFTWTNKRPQPVFSKIDRVFTSQEWSTGYPIITLEALEVIVSDHVPLVLTCKGTQQVKRQPKIECFWLKYAQPELMVSQLWQKEYSQQQPIAVFHQNTKIIQRALKIWHNNTFGGLEKRLQECKDAILALDVLEEQRPLSDSEFRARIQQREMAFELANNIESWWRQRSRIQWLKEGDRNTKAFHAYASSRLRRNWITSIHDNGVTISDQAGIIHLFYQSMKDILGQSSTVLPLDARALYPHNSSDPDLNFLANPFTEVEIEGAVFQLAKNKASGPDGLPNEFIQKYWVHLKGQIGKIMEEFYEGTLDLLPYNEGNIVLIPKTEAPTETGQFRPISVINLIPKLISKILSNRLSRVLPDLISVNQTAFVKGRQIADNFVTTREMLQHIAQTKNSAIFVKIDFRKAFDSVEWPFLIRVMQARNFPRRWIKWMELIWSTSSSKICINGDYSESFMHKRGLRQGDPLSPMMFNLAADVFQRMVQHLNSILPRPLTNKIDSSIVAHQYADDTAVIARADVTSLISLKLVLRLYTSISGLQINFNKSIFIPINVTSNQIQVVKAIIGCQQSQFPTTYLGMPLTIKKPIKELFIPLIEKVEKRLTSWQAKMVSRAGRLQLVQSVMSTILVYYMICFRLPKWVICRIDRARRRCLWGTYGKQGNGISLCNWSMATLPKE